MREYHTSRCSSHSGGSRCSSGHCSSQAKFSYRRSRCCCCFTPRCCTKILVCLIVVAALGVACVLLWPTRSQFVNRIIDKIVVAYRHEPVVAATQPVPLSPSASLVPLQALAPIPAEPVAVVQVATIAAPTQPEPEQAPLTVAPHRHSARSQPEFYEPPVADITTTTTTTQQPPPPPQEENTVNFGAGELFDLNNNTASGNAGDVVDKSVLRIRRDPPAANASAPESHEAESRESHVRIESEYTTDWRPVVQQTDKRRKRKHKRRRPKQHKDDATIQTTATANNTQAQESPSSDTMVLVRSKSGALNELLPLNDLIVSPAPKVYDEPYKAPRRAEASEQQPDAAELPAPESRPINLDDLREPIGLPANEALTDYPHEPPTPSPSLNTNTIETTTEAPESEPPQTTTTTRRPRKFKRRRRRRRKTSKRRLDAPGLEREPAPSPQPYRRRPNRRPALEPISESVHQQDVAEERPRVESRLELMNNASEPVHDLADLVPDSFENLINTDIPDSPSESVASRSSDDDGSEPQQTLRRRVAQPHSSNYQLPEPPSEQSNESEPRHQPVADGSSARAREAPEPSVDVDVDDDTNEAIDADEIREARSKPMLLAATRVPGSNRLSIEPRYTIDEDDGELVRLPTPERADSDSSASEPASSTGDDEDDDDSSSMSDNSLTSGSGNQNTVLVPLRAMPAQPSVAHVPIAVGQPAVPAVGELQAAAGHHHGKKKKKKKKKVVKKKKKKVYKVKKKKKVKKVVKKKKKVVVKKHKKVYVSKVKYKKKKKKKKGKPHHDSGHYYQYAKVPKKKSWEFGYKRGNKKHWIERHEKGHKNKFKTKVKWYDKKGKGKGIHVWDYNHHDKKKKKHF